jgi:hypothetical protein
MGIGDRILRKIGASQEQIDRVHRFINEASEEGVDVTHVPSPVGMNALQAREVEVWLKTQTRKLRDAKMQAETDKLNAAGMAPNQFARKFPAPGAPVGEGQPGLLYKMGITSPYSTHGLARNLKAKADIWWAMNMNMDVGREVAMMSERLAEAVKPYNANPRDRLAAMAGNQQAKDALAALTRKRGLTQAALDGEEAAIAEVLADPVMKEAYIKLRNILDEIAVQNGLELGQRISDYFPHIFKGSSGKWRLWRTMNALGSRGHVMARFFPDSMLPQSRTWRHGLYRTGEAGYDTDLEAIMHAYIKGGIERPYIRQFLKRAGKTLYSLPRVDASGKKTWIREAYSDWARFTAGMPTQANETVARFWRENDLFNHVMDNVIDLFGGGDMASNLALVRTRQAPANVVADVEDYFNQLIAAADGFTSTGQAMQGAAGQIRKGRAKMALWVDDVRGALSDPMSRPVAIDKLYGLMIMNKLAFSVSQGIVNVTQVLTNLYPKVGMKAMLRGMADYVGDPNAVIGPNGETRAYLLERSGIIADILEPDDIMPLGLGLRKKLYNAGTFMMRHSEAFNQGTSLFARYRQALEEGMSSELALSSARQMAKYTQHSYGRASRLPVMRNPLGRLLLMFKSYPLHQLNFSSELVEEAIRTGDYAPLTRHMMAYLTLFGAGATALGMTSLGERTQHPIPEMLGNMREYGFTRTMGGPVAVSMIEALQGQIKQGASEWTDPVIARRIAKATKAQNITDAMLNFSGLARAPNRKARGAAFWL